MASTLSLRAVFVLSLTLSLSLHLFFFLSVSLSISKVGDQSPTGRVCVRVGVLCMRAATRLPGIAPRLRLLSLLVV